MSVVFIVANEKQLQVGMEWCRRLITEPSPQTIEASKSPGIYLVIADAERKTLAEYIKRKVGDLSDDKIKVESTIVAQDVREVLAFAAHVRCGKLLMLYHPDDAEFQQNLFKESQCPALWLRLGTEPSTGAPRMVGMLPTNAQITELASRQLFGQPMSEVLDVDLQQASEDWPSAVLKALETQSLGSDVLLMCGVEEANKTDRAYAAGMALFKQSTAPAVALVHSGDTLIESFAGRLRAWGESIAPLMERQHRIDLANDLQVGSRPNLEYLGLISASAMLAAFGLLQDSAAVIIGAMLIAPLMTPILGAGLALTQGNRPLFKSSLLTITLGFAGALTASIAFGWLYWMFRDPVITPEMWARCQPSPLDFCVGLVGGLAASYARTRSHLSSALAGAAIAAALVPPISTAGLQIAFGVWKQTEQGTPVIGPLMLVTINVLTIMIGSSFVLWARGMRVERTLRIADRWVLRVFALLATLALLILTWVVVPHA